MWEETDFRISATAYEWTARALVLLEKVLKVNIKLHDGRRALHDGDIFVFNHFARFETFIPQYLIHRETGAFSRSVAAPEIFEASDAFTRYLLSLGALPSNYPGLLPFVAAEILRGRKAIIFPEGGMVKDRRVLDSAGRYSVFSRTARERRKHHTGAAVVAHAVDAFKAAVRDAHRAGQANRLLAWVRELGLGDLGALLAAAERPTAIVPCSITFHPIRISENPLPRIAELLNLELSPRALEELLVEGNLLLRDTDMDLRMGPPIRPAERWGWWDRVLLRRVGRRIASYQEPFSPGARPGGWDGRWLDRRAHAHALALRDEYMAGVYAQTTVNLSHLASEILVKTLAGGTQRVPAPLFHRMLYLSVKNAQEEPSLHLHRSLLNPEAYAGLPDGHCPAWRQLLDTAAAKGLVRGDDGHYLLLPRLREEQAFDRIRLENPVAVYANEVAPLPAATRAVAAAMETAQKIGAKTLARLRFDDQLRSYRWDREAFHRPRYETVNRDETASESGAPFLVLPKSGGRRVGVLLVHGFTASPAEIRPLADRLIPLGYPCLGVRLKGHGTSPWDLMKRGWDEWFTSVRDGYEILSAFADRVFLVGFSAGGALALRLAADEPPKLAGVAAVCAPLLWRDKAMSLVPAVHGANRLVRYFSAGGGVLPFHHSRPEHPSINYLHKPVEALHELQKLVEEMGENLSRVQCPALVLQATDDPTVDPESADLIYNGLGTAWKSLVLVPSSRHGILFEGTGETHERILAFLSRIEEQG